MRRAIIGFVGLLGLSACYGDPQTWQSDPAFLQRAYANAFQDQPFDVGPVYVLSEEHGELRTFLLRPCQNGTRICGSRTGSFEVTPDFTVVSGAYPGRTFYLSPGGDGYMIRNGQTVSLAWNE